MSWDDVIQKALAAKAFHENRFAPMQTPTIDNVALLFATTYARKQFMRHAVEERGWDLFFNSVDHVRGHLLENDYTVQFYFLRDPDDSNFRIETMFIVDGFSVTHFDLLRKYGDGAVAQGSYKPAASMGEDDVEAGRWRGYQRENTFLASVVGQPVECFEADYGRYTYFGTPDDEYGYLKTRINLRDI